MDDNSEKINEAAVAAALVFQDDLTLPALERLAERVKMAIVAVLEGLSDAERKL